MTFEQTLALACKAHDGQTYGNEPYVFHLWRVAERVRRQDEKLVALLHDIIEDTDYEAESLLSEGVHPAIVQAVVTITRGIETYNEYIDRVCTTPGNAGRLARIVKRADLEENLSQQFNGGSLRVRYLRALERLAAPDFGEA